VANAAVFAAPRTLRQTTPVSTWVTELVEEHLDEAELERQWEEFYRTVAPKRADVQRAEAIFKRLTKPARRRGAA
jgi:hypothetical protein